MSENAGVGVRHRARRWVDQATAGPNALSILASAVHHVESRPTSVVRKVTVEALEVGPLTVAAVCSLCLLQVESVDNIGSS